MVYTFFSSSKWSLFHNSNVFGSNIIHILYTGCAKIKKKIIPALNVAFYIFIQQIYVLNILNVVYTPRFFSSKWNLFHNSNIFGSCIIHFLYTVVLKLKKIIPAPKG